MARSPFAGSHTLVGACAALGCAWAMVLAAWAAHAGPALAAAGIAVSLLFTLHAAAAGYRWPGAVVAFSAPLIAASLFVLATGPHDAVALAGMAFVAVHGIVAWQLLARSRARFSDSVDADVERERVLAMLREQRTIAEEAVQLKTRFLASASHDLRQPMHAITLYLDGLADLELPPKARAAVTDARLCAHDMNDMFRSLLDLSRLDAQQAVPALGPFAIDAVLARVERELLPLAQARGTRLKVRPCGSHVFSDAGMVERIALNFASNAVRHAAGGKVLVGCRRRGATLRLAVYDTGPGIPASQQQAIFDEFHRADPSAPAHGTGGVGLGLAIVRRLAQTLRVPVTVRSTPGRGSMFAVDLPLVHVPRSLAGADRNGAPLAGRFIVVIDDEPAILQAVAFILEGAGSVLVTARSLEEAQLALAGTNRVPDAIVCDYRLGGALHGGDAILRLREEFNADIPALLVTGDTTGGPADAAAHAMAIPILYKPLAAATLQAALGRLLQT